jgi:hypothetical protein
MERRKFTREFKLEAVRLIKDRGVSYVQASQDLHLLRNRFYIGEVTAPPMSDMNARRFTRSPRRRGRARLPAVRGRAPWRLVMMQALLADECTDQAAGRFDFW